ncbi:cytochrome P450 [Streptomyces sp. NPDC018045]|uniref:cytochrome P450 n=1 Tax=Streptomyces sp. NPDC018045 TaxID=3365037 RepID=UPI00379FB086
MPVPAPTSEVDLFDDEVLADPYPAYAALRAAGPAVRLERHGVWAIPGYDDVRAALQDPHTYPSGGGVALTEQVNAEVLAGTVLAADGDAHRRLRKVLSVQLAPRAVRRLAQSVGARADRLVAEHTRGGAFDAAALARQMVTETVLDLMGLPETSEPTVAGGAAATFEVFGPANARYERALPTARATVDFLAKNVTREQVADGSWMHAIFRAVDAGQIQENEAVPLASAYTAASMDTTIAGLTETLYQLARHATQWDRLRRTPALAEAAFHEALRLEAPVQGFGRMVARTTALGGVRIEAGEQVWLLYGSTGRDRHTWGPRADRYDIARTGSHQHLAFGAGPHLCAGTPLALLQAGAVLRALAARCPQLAPAGEPTRTVNNVLRGRSSVPLCAELSRHLPPTATAPANKAAR